MTGSLAFAAAPPPSTDDQLRNSLDSKTGDDYDRELMGDASKPDAKVRVDDALQKKLQQELGPAAQKEDKPKDPLRRAAEGMRDVIPRLNKRDSGKVTQYLQRQIVSDLDELIDNAKKSGSKNGPKSGSMPKGGEKKPQNKPGVASEQGRSPVDKSDPRPREPEKMRAEELAKAREQMINVFHADLPPRTRQQVLEQAGEYFLPEYELEIEDYFRRLSQDQPESERR